MKRSSTFFPIGQPVQRKAPPTLFSHKIEKLSVFLFFAVSLGSAFLLFLVQPLIGKTLLPFYGGSASVWTTCLLFFQSILLAGYSYAHLLCRFAPPRLQLGIHSIVLGVALYMARILPNAPSESISPVAGLLLTLLFHVGLPFFALSTTAPLLQGWFFKRFPSRSPYPLYAVSNAGSFSAVLFYPFVFERFFPLPTQEKLWSIGFALFVAGCVFCATIVLLSRRKDRGNAKQELSPNTIVTSCVSSPWLWFGFSAAGSVLLLTTTEQISQDVAASPLFWMIPLCIYLLSYVICFAKESVYKRTPWIIALLSASLIVMVQIFFGGKLHVSVQLSLYVVTQFVGCMVAHGELAAQKPHASGLTRFYLWTSSGGIFGGLLVAVVAPAIFPDLWEYSLCWPVLLFLVWRALTKEASDFEKSIRIAKIKPIVAIGLFVSGMGFIVDVVYESNLSSFSSRNFYGRLTISETKHTRCLFHGRTLHGCQPKNIDKLAPAYYYSPNSGVGISYTRFSALRQRPLRTGIVGLGVGLCATWNRPGDQMRFYEINPEVITLASERFDYLKTSRGTVDTTLGDARLSLEKENKTSDKKFDILALDAFSSDAIPLHLLTKEALDIYRKRVLDDGILAFHISNRHLQLESMMRGAAEYLNWTPFIIHNDTDYKNYILNSTWVLITNNPIFIHEFRQSKDYVPWPTEHSDPLLFTDQYSNILNLL